MYVGICVLALVSYIFIEKQFITKNKQTADTAETVRPPNVQIDANAKYGHLSYYKIRPAEWTYDRIVTNPSLSPLEENKMRTYLDENISRLFDTGDNTSNSFMSHFSVESLLWKATYRGNTNPPERASLLSINLVATYKYKFDWFETTYFQLSDGNIGNITLELPIFSYENGKLTQKASIFPTDVAEYAAFERGVNNIVPFATVKNKVRLTMAMQGRYRALLDQITYTPYLAITNNELKLYIGTTNIAAQCLKQSQATDSNKVTTTDCVVDVSSKAVRCEQKASYCAGTL